MSHMRKETYTGIYAAIESRNGTTYLPEDVTGSLYDGSQWGSLMLCKDECDPELWDDVVSRVKDYIEDRDEDIRSIEIQQGTLYRLSAPGYMDCTEWTTDADDPIFDNDEPDGE